MPRIRGYATKGKRCFGKHDWGAKGRTNAIGALLNNKLLTVSLCQHNINTEIFDAWVGQDLMPKLPPESVIVLDNATFHKGSTMHEDVAKAGHTILYLPPYSPDLNPIEKKWAQLKSIKHTTQCSIDDLFQKDVHTQFI